MGRTIRLIAAYFAASFVSHFAWEMGQSPFFANFTDDFARHVWACFVATATGDMLFMLVIYLTLAIALCKWSWITEPASYRHPATWLLPPLVGVLLAVSFELWAIYAVGRWEYGSMPVIPVLRVGLLPVLQMIFVPWAVIGLCWCVLRLGGAPRR